MSNIITVKSDSYQVRYATEKNGKIFLIVGKNLKTGQYADTFDGEFGDEIEYSKEGLNKFEVKIPSGFKV